MLDTIAKNFGWVVTIGTFIIGAIVHIVRTFDSLNQLKKRVAKLEVETNHLKSKMSEVTSDLGNQKEKLGDLKEAADGLKDAVNRLNTNIEVIAMWVKVQGGDTLLLRKDN